MVELTQNTTPASSKNQQCVPVCPCVNNPAASAKTVLVVVNGPKPEAVWRAHGTLDDNIRQALDNYGITHCDVQLEVMTSYEETSSPLPVNVSKYAAVIFGGSKFDVTDGAPWMFSMMEWIRAHAEHLPMLGICFGHQIIGHALGGEAMKNSRGCEAGTYMLTRKPLAAVEAARDPVASFLPDSFPAHLLHGQSVERLPHGAVSFFESEIERNQFVRFAPMVYGTQFHPEFTAPTVVTYLDYCGSWNVPNTASKLPTHVDCNAANMIIGRFVEVALAASHNNNHQQ